MNLYNIWVSLSEMSDQTYWPFSWYSIFFFRCTCILRVTELNRLLRVVDGTDIQRIIICMCNHLMFTLNFYYSTVENLMKFIYLVEGAAWREILVYLWMICCIGYLQHTHTRIHTHTHAHTRTHTWMNLAGLRIAAMYWGERSKGSQFSSGLAPLTQTEY